MDYVVDEIVVRGDEAAQQHAVRAGASATHTGTGSDTGLESSGASMHGSIRREDSAGDDANVVWRLIRYRAWPLITYFFAPSFEPAEKEDEFRKMIWYQRKSTGFWCVAHRGDAADATGMRSSWSSTGSSTSC